MVTQLRTYDVKPGTMNLWADMFSARVRPLRERMGFRVDAAYVVPAASQFVWIVTFDGTEAELEAADVAYYELEEHVPMHEEALRYLEGSASSLVVPLS